MSSWIPRLRMFMRTGRYDLIVREPVLLHLISLFLPLALVGP